MYNLTARNENFKNDLSETISLFLHLFELLTIMKEEKIVHNDLKPDNILFDKEKNQLFLSSDFSGGNIVLEYISDGSTSDGTYEIHVYAEEALRAYIWWKHLQRKRNHPLQEKELARRDFYNKKRI